MHIPHGGYPPTSPLSLLTHKASTILLPLTPFSHSVSLFAGLTSTSNNTNTALPSRLRSIFKRFRSSSRPATSAYTKDESQMMHHVDATSSIVKREPSLPPTPPISLQTTRNEILDELSQQFAVSTQKLRAITTQFVSEMQKGLHHDGETGIVNGRKHDIVLTFI